jgi:hypothetical protein
MPHSNGIERQGDIRMAKMRGVPAQAFDISSITISDNGRFEFTSKGDPYIVRTGPTVQEAEAFATVLRQMITDYRKRKT